MLDNNGTDKHKSMRYLWGYVISLFAISLFLIFLSYISQQNLKNDLLNANQNLTLEMENADSMENMIRLQQQLIDGMNGSLKNISPKIAELAELIDKLENNNNSEPDSHQEEQMPLPENDAGSKEKQQIILKMRKLIDEISKELSEYSI